MPQGQPVTDPQRFAEEYPEFQEYGQEGLMAAMDAYNGAIAQGQDIETAMKMAHEAGQAAAGVGQTGQSPAVQQGPARGGGPAASPRRPAR